MSEVVQVAEAAPVAAAATTRRGFVRHVMLGQKVALVGAIVLLFFIVIAVIGPWIEPYSTTTQVGKVYAPPTGKHVLGLDDGGIDMLSEVIQGARVSMIVGFAGAAVAMLIGGGVGLLSGYFGGKTDIALMRITDYFLVIPDVPLMIVAAAVFGRSLVNVILIIGVIYWTSTARLIRAQVKSVRERVYVKRARALGGGHGRLLWKHITPQVAPLLVANTVLTIAIAVFAETYIAFLGLEDPSTISWGKLIQNSLTGGAIFHKAWWAIIPPGLCVTVVILAATMMGQAMEDALNPRLRVGHLSVRRFRLRPLRGRLDSE
ncbi:MAG TPA: ABC transporter permease [Gaiellales bacterium]|nr:ABC transporter permease [Gaiellales bacterium]